MNLSLEQNAQLHRVLDGKTDIADPYPGTKADIAEAIRERMEKASVEIQDKYWDVLQESFTHRKQKTDNDKGWFFGGWMIFGCTPQDKITAFLKATKKGQ